MQLGEKLLKLRKEHLFTQETLAEQLGVSRQTVSKWELGEAIPDTTKIILLSRLLNVSTDYLLKDELEQYENINAGYINESNIIYEKRNETKNIIEARNVKETENINETKNIIEAKDINDTKNIYEAKNSNVDKSINEASNMNKVRSKYETKIIDETISDYESEIIHYYKQYIGKWVKIFLDDQGYGGLYQVGMIDLNQQFLLFVDTEHKIGLVSVCNIKSITLADIYKRKRKEKDIPPVDTEIIDKSRNSNPLEHFIGKTCEIRLVCKSIFAAQGGYYRAIIESIGKDSIIVSYKGSQNILMQEKLLVIFER